MGLGLFLRGVAGGRRNPACRAGLALGGRLDPARVLGADLLANAARLQPFNALSPRLVAAREWAQAARQSLVPASSASNVPAQATSSQFAGRARFVLTPDSPCAIAPSQSLSPCASINLACRADEHSNGVVEMTRDLARPAKRISPPPPALPPTRGRRPAAQQSPPGTEATGRTPCDHSTRCAHGSVTPRAWCFPGAQGLWASSPSWPGPSWPVRPRPQPLPSPRSPITAPAKPPARSATPSPRPMPTLAARSTSIWPAATPSRSRVR